MDLADLKTSISNLSDEQLMTTLMGIRANRRVSKAQPTQKKSNLQVSNHFWLPLRLI
jgi:hypothetical protein